MCRRRVALTAPRPRPCPQEARLLALLDKERDRCAQLVAAAQRGAQEAHRNVTREVAAAARRAERRAQKEAQQAAAALRARVAQLEAEAQTSQVPSPPLPAVLRTPFRRCA